MAEGDDAGQEVRWVGLVALRSELDQARAHAGFPPYDRADVDAALHRLARQPGIHVQAEANQQALTAEDRDAGVRFGGSTRHLLLIENGA